MSSPPVLESVAAMIGAVSFMIVIAWIAHSGFTNRRLRRQAEISAQLHDKLIDKFDSTAELAEFLNSPMGERVLSEHPQEQPRTHGRILTSLQVGVVLAPLSIGLLSMQDVIPEAAEGFRFLGIMGLCLAIGFLASAGVAAWASRRWGLISPRPDAES